MILVAFIFLTMPIFIGIVAFTYFSNDRIARESAFSLIDRFCNQAVKSIQDEIKPIRSLVSLAATLGGQTPQFYNGEAAFLYFQRMVQHSDMILSAYVGLSDGSFRQLRRMYPDQRVFNQLAPKGTEFAARRVTTDSRGLRSDSYRYLDAQGAELGAVSAASTYDPLTRVWYQTAVRLGGIIVTEPSVFASFGLIGLTVAHSFVERSGALGVVSIDITLDSISRYLAQNKISPESFTFILDAEDRIVASSDPGKGYISAEGQVKLQHISSLGSELPPAAFGARPRDAEGSSKRYTYLHGGKEYLISLSEMPPDIGNRWQLFVVSPVTDFTVAFNRNNQRLLLIGFAALVLQLIIIYLMSKRISKPLEQLVENIDSIRQLEARRSSGTVSSIREISSLSRAIQMLDNTVNSFSSYVPVGLVRQLLESEQELKLGGTSRFMTMFFSDLEAFSTLSEQIPAQELVLRVSGYLELVTQKVHAEQGTIGDFVGDGVMAFWGAPTLLEDHAWRSCVAALRIRDGMAGVNARWDDGRRKPLYVRMGIHSDAVIVGNIGSRERMKYSVMGDGVNIASRLEGLNKHYGTQICISHSVFKEAGERLCVRPIDEVTVKGRRSGILIYELMGAYGIGQQFEPTPKTLQLCELTRKAYDAVVTGDRKLAVERYQEVLQGFPNDPVSTEMLKRLIAV